MFCKIPCHAVAISAEAALFELAAVSLGACTSAATGSGFGSDTTGLGASVSLGFKASCSTCCCAAGIGGCVD